MSVLVSIAVLLSGMLIPSAGHAAQESMIIRQTLEGFDPPSVVIDAGQSVEFINDRPDPVWVASDVHPTHMGYPGSDISGCDETSGMFDACGETAPGGSFVFRFDEPGTWGFHDHLHPSEGGYVIVRGTSTRAWRSALPWWRRVGAAAHNRLYAVAPGYGDAKVREFPLRALVRDPQEREYLVRRFGYDRVLDALERPAGSTGSAICHVEGHYIGRIAYELGLVRIAEAGLDTRCQFGFYHGLMETGIGNVGTDETIIALAEECDARKDDLIFVLSCYHGIGHGLTVYHRYDLPTALEKCRLIPSPGGQRLCYHGAFMENSFVSRGFGVEHESPWLKEDDLWFPCFDVRIASDPSAPICAFSLPTIWSAESFDPDTQIARCQEMEGPSRAFCFQGFGFNTNAWHILPETEMRRVCESIDMPGDRADCVTGAVIMASLIRAQTPDFARSALCEGSAGSRQACAEMIRDRLSWALEL